MSQKEKVLIITGPTASGKSDVALRIAELEDGVIINADSKQVYKEIPIITSQPNIVINNGLYYLYGYISIHSYYSVKIWLEDIASIIKSAWNKNKVAIIVGGTGMYINALLNGLIYKDVECNLRNKLENQLRILGNKKFYETLSNQGIDISTIHHNDSYRLVRAAEQFFSKTKKKREDYTRILKDASVCILMPKREIIYDRINKRFSEMLGHGVIDEIKSLKNDFDYSMPAAKSCGVMEISRYLNNEISLSSAVEEAMRSTRKYAKRQITWFRNQCKYATFFENSESLLSDYKKI